jgi:hypothetical protein
MVEIRVAVADATGVDDLAQRLAGVVDGSCVSLDRACKEVSVRSRSESRGVTLVLNAVEAWLAENGVGSRRSCRSAITPTRWTLALAGPDSPSRGGVGLAKSRNSRCLSSRTCPPEGPDLADQIARELMLRIVRGEKLPSETQ